MTHETSVAKQVVFVPSFWIDDVAQDTEAAILVVLIAQTLSALLVLAGSKCLDPLLLDLFVHDITPAYGVISL